MCENVFLIIICVVLAVSAAVLAVCLLLIYRRSHKKYAELEYKFTHDEITGHTNWTWLWSKIGHSVHDATLPYDFVHFDIKEFHLFNELYDHFVGNDVLCFVSKKINEQDFIKYSARCHNDNFAFVTEPMPEEELRPKLEAFFESMKYMPGYEERPIYFRCGVVEKNREIRAQDTVADLAKMAQATGQKPNCTEISFYDDAMKEKLMRGEHLKHELPGAIERDEILVYLQPKFDPNTEHITGAEALVRWMYNGKELLFPGAFIPYLENTDAINMLDEHVIEKVCRYYDKWKKEGKKLYPISINLSQKEIYKENLTEGIVKIVDSHNVEHSLIEFELTESAAYEDKDYLLKVMHELRASGFSLSMDDFGTGYSSFSLLKDMPLNTLKIDKSFVDTIGSKVGNERGQQIVEDIVGMVKHLSLGCVAEGVEDEEQKDILKSWGCDYIQGYYYSKPIPVEKYEEYL